MSIALPRIDLADVERALVVSYAPSAARAALAILWALDERLGMVVATTREPGLGRIRLAWWREALARLDVGPPSAEPQLTALAATVVASGVPGRALCVLADGWEELLGAPLDADAIARFAMERGAGLFGIAASVLGTGAPSDLAAAGELWAMVDLARHRSDAETRRLALAAARVRIARCGRPAWPKALRPLAALTALARSDARRGRLDRRPGSPSRVARLALAGLTGR